MKVRFSTILTIGRLSLPSRFGASISASRRKFPNKKKIISKESLGDQGKRRPENYHIVTSDHALSLFTSAWETNPSSPVSDRRNESYKGKVFNRTREY